MARRASSGPAARSAPLTSAIARARSARHLPNAVWVSLGSGVFGFGVGLCFWSSLEFRFENPFEIVSRITLARYPKQQDLFAYAIAISSVAVGVAAGWYAWCALASARLRSGLPARVEAASEVADTAETESRAALDAGLSLWTWPFAALLVSLVPISRASWGVGELVALPLLAAGLTAGCAFFVARARPGVVSVRHCEVKSSEASSDTRTWPPLPAALGFRTGLLALVVPLLLYAWLYDGFLVHHRIDMHHEGEILAPWSALMHGEVPFRDIYVQHGLFQNVGKGWLAEKLFGVSLASLRATEHLLGPLGHVALYFLALAVLRSWLSAVAVVLVASVANLWIVDRQAFGLLAVAALAYASRGGPAVGTPTGRSGRAGLLTNGMAALSGAATTLAFFYSAEIGLFSAAACGAFLIIRLLFDRGTTSPSRWLPLVFYPGGAIACFLPFAIALANVDALDALLRNTWQQIAYQPTVWGRPYPPLLETLTGIDSLETARAALLGKWFQWYLPPLVYLFAVGCLTLRTLRGRLWQTPNGGASLLVLLAALGYFASSLSRADSFHLKFGTLLMWVLVGLAIEGVVVRGWRAMRHASGFAPRFRAAAWPLLACGAIALHLALLHHPIDKLMSRANQIQSGRYWPRSVPATWPRLGGIRIGDGEFAHARDVVRYVQRRVRPQEPIFDFSSQPAYYFLAQRPNPTRYALAAYAATPDMQREVIDDLERSATKLVIYRSGGYLDRLDQVPFEKRNPLIEAYLRESYDKASQIGGTVILLRKNWTSGSNPESSQPP